MVSRRIYAAIFVMIVTSLTIIAALDYRGRAIASPVHPAGASELLASLPASDAVAFLDGQRTVAEVLPRVFANNADVLAHLNKEMDKFRDDMGTDPRLFDSIAVSLRFKKNGTTSTDFVSGLMRGGFSASEALTTGLAKAKAKRNVQYTEEQYDGTTIYTLSKSGGFSLAVFDSNTIAFGDIAGIRATLDARASRAPHADSSLIQLATLNAGALGGFAANIPPATAKNIAADDDFGKAFANITQIYGSVDATATNWVLALSLRSGTGQQAEELAEKLNSLRQLASIYLSQNDSAQSENGSGGADVKSRVQAEANDIPFFKKWIKEVTITAEGNDVKLRLEEPLTDVATFFAGH